MSCSVQYSSYFDDVICFVGFVDDAIRKTVCVTPADIFEWVTATVKKWIFCHSLPRFDNLFDELSTESRIAALIPIGCFNNILLDLRRELDPPFHLPYRERTRDFMSSKDNADFGSSLRAASRESTRASSALSNGESSNSKAWRINSCRCSKVSVGSSWRTSLKLMPLI